VFSPRNESPVEQGARRRVGGIDRCTPPVSSLSLSQESVSGLPPEPWLPLWLPLLLPSLPVSPSAVQIYFMIISFYPWLQKDGSASEVIGESVLSS
jgi:hypothetical protein